MNVLINPSFVAYRAGDYYYPCKDARPAGAIRCPELACELDQELALERIWMAPDTILRQALERLEKALNTLEEAVDLRLDKEGDFAEAEEEVQRMNADRSRLAQELDQSEARAERLEAANREVSRRLVTAMETIRAVLDR
ncbi:conserved hypothetical protein [Brucella ovis ATCC 25840]|uniref:DUF4164 family protein n=1 Tax=Brucella ovis (strain ATCC 25840 / 63/290 / NCTC 10512) TaxID=444178 RepID=A0A0H3ARL6_BRUO2|nr:conserved hypothetical protein [Brucella ovis ATCC 25840]